MRRETFVAILSAALAEADADLVSEAKGLIFWRERELKAETVRRYAPGLVINFLAKDGTTRKQGTIDHLNKFSVSVKHSHPTEGFVVEVVPIERVLGLAIVSLERDPNGVVVP